MKTITLFFAFLISVCSINAQQTYVPDRNFEELLIRLCLDTFPPNSYVPTRNIDTVTSLDVSWKSISNLTGIEDFKALIHLNCSNNELTSLDLSKNTALTELYCSWNEITSLDVLSSSDLTHLYCYNNELTSLDVSKNTALTVLVCSNNILTSLDVSGCTDLIELVCSYNSLTSLDVSKNTALTEFDCSRNEIVSLDVSGCSVLEELSCFYNPHLYCIQVADSINAINNPDWEKDEHAVWSEDCSLVSVEEETNSGNKISISPNPASDYIEINNVILNEVKDPEIKVFDVLGIKYIDSRLRGNDILVSSEGNVRIDVSSLSPGVYFVSVGGKMYKFVKM